MVTAIAQSPVISTAKFNQLINEALTEGPKKVKDLYAVALNRQPQDCPDIPCPHRKKAGKCREWQHELQRQLNRIAYNQDGLWHLKAVTVTPLPTTPQLVVEPIIKAPATAPVLIVPDTPAPYTGDPFILTEDGHYMDVEELAKAPEKRFFVPKNFDEFYARYPHYIQNWVKRRLNKFAVDDDVEDWTQDLILHMRYLPIKSKHRQPGANGHVEGCRDVIETFDPVLQYGASERRFRNYLNFCLANKFLTVQAKKQKNPICRAGNIPFGSGSADENTNDMYGSGSGDEFVHANSEYLANNSAKSQKQQDDRLLTNEFRAFVELNDPSALPAIDALQSTGSVAEGAAFLGVEEGEYTRLRNRLKQLGQCFRNGSNVPKRRKPYKKRTMLELVPSPDGLR